MPVSVPYSKSTVFKIGRQKMCRFRVNGRPIRRIFHRFQNVPASYERSLSSFCTASLLTRASIVFNRISQKIAHCLCGCCGGAVTSILLSFAQLNRSGFNMELETLF